MSQDVSDRHWVSAMIVLGGFLVACFGVALIGSLVTAPAIPDWYGSIEKPVWTPPNAVFGPVWTVLYAMIAISGWLVWRSAGFTGARTALTLFAAQLLLNLGWSIIFFGFRQPALAFLEIVLLWFVIVATIWTFALISRTAALLLVPYLLWVTFAAALNLVIWRLNQAAPA